MPDSCESDEEIPLPPLKPQKTLFAFLSKKTNGTNGSKSIGKTDPEDIHSPVKISRKKRKKNYIQSDDEEEEDKEVQQKHEAVAISKELVEETPTIKAINYSKAVCENIPVMSAPFPTVNHVYQPCPTDDQDNHISAKNNATTFKRKECEIPFQFNENGSYRNLISLNVKENLEIIDVLDIEQKTIDEWISVIQEDFPDVSVKKIFQQYLANQKDVISSNLSKKLAAKAALETLWKRDSEMKQKEENLKVTQQIESVEPVVPVKKEGQDIRSMFKKKKPTKKTKKSVKNIAKDQQIDNNKNSCDIEMPDESLVKSISKKAETQECKAMPMKINGLFGKAQKRLEEKRKQKLQNMEESKKEISNVNKEEENMKTKDDSKGNDTHESAAEDDDNSKENGRRSSRRIRKQIDKKNDKVKKKVDGNKHKNLRQMFNKVDKQTEVCMEDEEIIVEKVSKGTKEDESDYLDNHHVDNAAQDSTNSIDNNPESKQSKKKTRSSVDIRSIFKKESKPTEPSNINNNTEEGLLASVSNDEQIQVIVEKNYDDTAASTDSDIVNDTTQGVSKRPNHSIIKVATDTEESTYDTAASTDSDILNDTSQGVSKRLNHSIIKVATDTEESPCDTADENDTKGIDTLKCENLSENKKKDIRSFFHLSNKKKKPTENMKVISHTENDSIENKSKNTATTNSNVKENVHYLYSHQKTDDFKSNEINVKENEEGITLGQEVNSESVNHNCDSHKKKDVCLPPLEIVTPSNVKIENCISPCRVVAEDVSSLLNEGKIVKSESIQMLSPTDTEETSDDIELKLGPSPVEMTTEDDGKGFDRKRKRKCAAEVMQVKKKIKREEKQVKSCRKSLRNRSKPTICYTEISKDDKSDNDIEVKDGVMTENEVKHKDDSSIMQNDNDNNNKSMQISSEYKTTQVNIKKAKNAIVESSVPAESELSEPPLRRSSRARKTVQSYSEVDILPPKKETSEKPKEKKKACKSKETDSTEKVKNNNSTLDDSVMEIIEKKPIVEKEIQPLPISPAKKKPVIGIYVVPKKKVLSKTCSRQTAEVILNEDTVNSYLSWTEKYQPTKARYVIGDKGPVKELFTWLSSWKERHESIIKKMAERAALKRSTKSYDSDSDYSDDSDDEDNLSNTLLLSGPCGCGTTTAVYACAKQMDFKILELNPTMYRTGKRIYDQVAEAVVSHQVRKGIKHKTKPSNSITATKSVSTFFTNKSSDLTATTSSVNKPVKSAAKKETTIKADEMSLILFEQVDIVYEEQDRGFWQGIADLRKLAKRPMILTSNDVNVKSHCDGDENMWVEQITLQKAESSKILPLLQIMCLAEQIFVPKNILLDFINLCQQDIRKIMLQLQFWFEQYKEPLFHILKSKNKSKSNELAVESINKSSELIDVVNTTEPNVEPSETCESMEVDIVTSDKENIVVKNCIEIENSSTGSPTKTNVSQTSIGKLDVDTIEKTIDRTMDETMDRTIDKTVENKRHQIINNKPFILPKSLLKECPLREIKEIFLSPQKVLLSNNFENITWSHYSFLKKRNSKEEEEKISKKSESSMICLANTAEMLSSFDSYGHTDQERDQYHWSVPCMESLEDSLTMEKEQLHRYPIEEMCVSAHETLETCHLSLTQQPNNQLNYAHERCSDEFNNIYTSVERRLALSYSVEHRSLPMDVIPTLHSICVAEKFKRESQQRRRANRRFLHYLDSMGMCLDEDVMKRLSDPLF